MQYELIDLLDANIPPVPDDFADFWRARHARALEVDVAPELDGSGGVTYTSTDGFRVGGWLTLPDSGPVTRGMVVVHGYGGREAPEPDLLPPGTAAIWPCARGIGERSLDPEIPADSAAHVLHGIGSRDTYVHGGCVEDVWCAASALLSLVPEAAGRLDFFGVSFGGGIGALALPWDERFHSAMLEVPSFGNHPLRMTIPCSGSGHFVQAYHAEHPEVLDVLRYFDAATAATFVRVPVHVAAALEDPSVPPPGQFAVYNALGGQKRLFPLTAGHMPYPGEAEEHARLSAERALFLA